MILSVKCSGSGMIDELSVYASILVGGEKGCPPGGNEQTTLECPGFWINARAWQVARAFAEHAEWF